MPLTERPDAGYINELKSQLEGEWSKAHAKFADIDLYIQNTFPVWDKEEHKGRSAMRPAKAPAILNHAVDNQLGYNPTFTVIPDGLSDTAKKNADMAENFLGAVFHDAALREMALPWKLAGRFIEAYGYCVVEGPLLDWEDEPKASAREKGETEDEFAGRQVIHKAGLRNWNPFRVKVPHPARVLLPPFEKQPSVAIKRSMMYAIELERLSARKAKTRRYAAAWTCPDGTGFFDQVEVAEYWTADWHALMVASGDLLFVERNLWGFVPFSHAYEGSGTEPTNYAQIDPSYYCTGIYEHIRGTLKAQAQALSAHHELLLRRAFVPFATPRSPEQLAQQLARGEIIQAEEGEVFLPPTPEVTQWMFQHIKNLDEDLESGTYISALYGAKQPGVSTVGQQAILSTAAAKRFVAPQMQMEHLASIVAGRILRLVEVLSRTITVRGFSLGPENVRGNYAVEVKFPMIDEVMQMQRVQQAQALVAAGLLSTETFWANYLLLEDHTQEQKRIYKDMVRKLPTAAIEGMKVVAQEMGMEEVVKRFEEEQAGQAQEQSVGPGGNGGAPLRQPLTPSTVKPAPRRGL